ncbi:hypothetical protein BDY21DRAFT_342301 [Lineolata rhizophorae]|uniref:Uncharacterized protein n=1 Tax=Lineolata rhizophorae TaxID=578093 RepID=A0A6A6P2X6_9PEZI|nr:hypothetical protein BDY21DRAFT_342301 [Lineolata rhizophorae]
MHTIDARGIETTWPRPRINELCYVSGLTPPPQRTIRVNASITIGARGNVSHGKKTKFRAV